MGALQAIRKADALLPGKPVEEGQDPRWQAIIAVGEYVESDPEQVWAFIRRWGGHPQEDLRDAIATCLLEHLLESDFERYFARVEERALAEPLFGDMFLRCWQIGMANQPGNAQRFESLGERLRPRRR